MLPLHTQKAAKAVSPAPNTPGAVLPAEEWALNLHTSAPPSHSGPKVGDGLKIKKIWDLATNGQQARASRARGMQKCPVHQSSRLTEAKLSHDARQASQSQGTPAPRARRDSVLLTQSPSRFPSVTTEGRIANKATRGGNARGASSPDPEFDQASSLPQSTAKCPEKKPANSESQK